jgi:hypothetical protein
LDGVKKVTIYRQLKEGERGQGKIAELTPEQVKELKSRK